MEHDLDQIDQTDQIDHDLLIDEIVQTDQIDHDLDQIDQTDQIDHDLDRLGPEMLCKICLVQIKPRKHVVDHPDYTAPPPAT